MGWAKFWATFSQTHPVTLIDRNWLDVVLCAEPEKKV
jgi:hypothetical protein